MSKVSINLNEKPCADGQTPARNQTSADSLISIIFPWRGVNTANRRVLIDRYESGRTTTSVGFYLCMMSVLLLCTGVGLSVVSIWLLVYRVPYVHITSGSSCLEANSFALSAGIISIISWWIGWICHDNKKNYVFLPLLLAVLALSLCLLLAAIGIGFVQKSRLVFERKTQPVRLVSNYYRTSLNETMNATLKLYDENDGYKNSWNKVQQRLKCCGIEGPRDWLRADREIPWSCYNSCLESKTLLLKGCLDRIAYEYAWEICLLTGLSLITFCVQIVTMLLVCLVYVRDKAQIKSNVSSK